MDYLRRFFVVLLCACTTANAYTQRIDVDSLLRTPPNESQVIERTKWLLSLSEAYLTVNTDSALFCANTALSFSKATNNSMLEAGSYIAIGQSYDYVNQQIIALENFLQAKDIYTGINNDSGLAVTFYSMGEMYNTLREL